MQIPTPDELRQIRLQLGLTQEKLANATGLSQGLIARIESGKVDPRTSTLRKIINTLESAKQKVIRAEDLMVSPTLTVNYNKPVKKAVQIMQENSISQLPVLKNNIPVGMLNERTLLKKIEYSSNPDELKNKKVGDVMGEVPPLISKSTDLRSVLPLLEFNNAVLVLDKGKLCGIITRSDILGTI